MYPLRSSSADNRQAATGKPTQWEESLRERAAIDPHSTVPLLDTLLAPFRTEPAGNPGRHLPG